MRVCKGQYKYQLDADEWFDTGMLIADTIETPWFTMYADGRLLARRGYAYDGPSGPTIHTKLFIWTSLPHDIGYQMIRAGLLPDSYRPKFDDLLKRMNLEGKPATATTKRIKPMWKIRARWIHRAVRVAGHSSVSEEKRKKVMEF